MSQSAPAQLRDRGGEREGVFSPWWTLYLNIPQVVSYRPAATLRSRGGNCRHEPQRFALILLFDRLLAPGCSRQSDGLPDGADLEAEERRQEEARNDALYSNAKRLATDRYLRKWLDLYSGLTAKAAWRLSTSTLSMREESLNTCDGVLGKYLPGCERIEQPASNSSCSPPVPRRSRMQLSHITRHAYENWERTCGTGSSAGLAAQPEVTVLN